MMCNLNRYASFEYRKAEFKICDERILLYEDDATLIAYFNIWKITEVSILGDTYVSITFDDTILVINFLKEKVRAKIIDSLEEIKVKKRKYFSVVPFPIMDYINIGDSMAPLAKLYEESRFLLPKPKIWGKTSPAFFDELNIFRFEGSKKKDLELKSPTKVYRRKSIKTLLHIDLDSVLECELPSKKYSENDIIDGRYEKLYTKRSTILSLQKMTGKVSIEEVDERLENISIMNDGDVEISAIHVNRMTDNASNRLEEENSIQDILSPVKVVTDTSERFDGLNVIDGEDKSVDVKISIRDPFADDTDQLNNEIDPSNKN